MLNQIVVAGAIVRGCTVLVAHAFGHRSWRVDGNFPVGKVATAKLSAPRWPGELAEELRHSRSPTSRWATVGDDMRRIAVIDDAAGLSRASAWRRTACARDHRGAVPGDGGRTARC